ncbi:MAG: heparan-alpha-glucosaminide N-acetyltransferase domain-containing protein, partial [Psychrosphaera sp.]|nr:heparan-alpha-glucosaminide N-acetyltransferase domain-containing protein [Psychrosphaera sp.]
MTDILQKRLVAIDILRGLIIVLMALDHTRDFWGAAGFNPTDLSQTTPAWFLTRWVTHFCAPLFVFLTGVSAMLYSQKLESKAQLRNYLLSRGVWLIILELTIVNLSWQVGYSITFVQVIWVLGMSMVILSGLIYLPKRWILALTLPILLLHNAIDDNAVAAAFGSAD